MRLARGFRAAAGKSVRTGQFRRALQVAGIRDEQLEDTDGIGFHAGGQFDEFEGDGDGVSGGTVGDEPSPFARDDAARREKTVRALFVPPADAVDVVVAVDEFVIVEFESAAQALVDIGIETVERARAVAALRFLADETRQPDEAGTGSVQPFFAMLGIGRIGRQRQFLAAVFDGQSFFAVAGGRHACQARIIV